MMNLFKQMPDNVTLDKRLQTPPSPGVSHTHKSLNLNLQVGLDLQHLSCTQLGVGHRGKPTRKDGSSC